MANALEALEALEEPEAEEEDVEEDVVDEEDADAEEEEAAGHRTPQRAAIDALYRSMKTREARRAGQQAAGLLWVQVS
jgi:hypothetical protein